MNIIAIFVVAYGLQHMQVTVAPDCSSSDFDSGYFPEDYEDNEDNEDNR